MNLYVLLFTTLLVAVTPLDARGDTTHDVVFDAVLVDVALEQCGSSTSDSVNHRLLSDLLSIERAAGIPEKYRGMVLAAACSESRYSSKARGDEGKAIGILQLWPWWERVYQVDRTDPYDSADAWTGQIMKALPKARRKCGKRRGFVSAWAWVASGPKGWRCRAPRHYKRLRRWQRLVRERLQDYEE